MTTNPRMGGKNQQCQVKPTEWFWLSKNLSNTEHHCTETANLLHPMTAYQMRNSPTRANTRKHAQTQTHVNTCQCPIQCQRMTISHSPLENRPFPTRSHCMTLNGAWGRKRNKNIDSTSIHRRHTGASPAGSHTGAPGLHFSLFIFSEK